MKLNFRKIASVLSSAVMVSSTVALAAAASYPAPFVNSGTADVAVVWGSTATLDNAAVTDLVSSLNSRVTPGTTTTTTTTGESFTLQKERNKFNLNDNLNTIYSSLDVDELPALLADGTYESEDGESDYTQKVIPGTKGMSFFQDDDFNDEKPILGFAFSDGDHILNYTLEMDTAVAVEQDTDIVILGKKYYIADNSSTDNSITLLDASASQRINEGDTVTVEATNGQTYTVKLDYVEEETSDSDEANANFIVNDEAIDSMEPGDTEEIEDGVYIVVDKVDYIDSDRRTSYAQFSLGTGKLLLTNGEEVELNDDPISTIDDMTTTVYANFTLSSGKLSKITLDWQASDDAWLAPGTDLVLPGFGGLKLSMGELKSGDYEETTLTGNGDAFYLNTEIKDGEVSIPILHHTNGAADLIGKDSDEILVTAGTGGAASRTLTLDQNLKPTFVASWIDGDEGESHAFKVKKVINNSDDKMEVTLDDLAAGKDDVTITGIGESVDVGELTLTLQDAVESTKVASINITPSGTSGAFVYADRVVTKNGLVVRLPVLGANTTIAPNINFSASGNYASWTVNFEEEDKDDTISASTGGRFNVTYSVSSSDGFEPSNVVGATLEETEEDSDQYLTYIDSELATKIEMDKPSSGVNSITISYPDSQSYAEVMVAESGATIGGGSSGNIVPIFDTDSVPTDKNLIVVGGSCVNTLAASLLGLPANSCGNAWQTKTGVGAGQFLIQTFARDGGKVATLVAGYNMEDTANAVKALKTDTTVDIAANKKFVGTATSVQAVNVA